MATLCNSGNVKLAAGADVSTALTNADYTEFINQAEGQLTADTGVNWVTVWSTISGNSYAKIVEQAVAAFAGNSAIRYDLKQYTSLNEAISMININLDKYDRAVNKLKDANVYKPFGGGTAKLVE